MIKEYYNILEIPLSKPLTEELIKSQYRKLVKKYHPDSSSEEFKDGKMFILLKEAYDFLTLNYEILNITMRISDEFGRNLCLEIFTFLKNYMNSLEEDQKNSVTSLFMLIRVITKDVYKYKSETVAISYMVGILKCLELGVDPLTTVGCLFRLSIEYMKLINFSNCKFKIVYNAVQNHDCSLTLFNEDDIIMYLIIFSTAYLNECFKRSDVTNKSISELKDAIGNICDSPMFDKNRSSWHYIRFMIQKIKERMKNG